MTIERIGVITLGLGAFLFAALATAAAVACIGDVADRQLGLAAVDGPFSAAFVAIAVMIYRMWREFR